MTDRIDKVADLAGCPITNTPLSASATVIEVAAKAADVGQFSDPLSQGYDAVIWHRGTHASALDAQRAGLAESVRVTGINFGGQTLTVTRGSSPLNMTLAGEYWIAQVVGAQLFEDIDDRIFDLVGGELVRNVNLEAADVRADNARFAGTPWFDVTHSDYGATGNGSTDDTVAVAAAIDACVSAGGGVVYFPQGNYNLSSWATAGDAYAANVTLLGDGEGSIITGDAGDDFVSVVNEMQVFSLAFSGWNSVFNMDGNTGTIAQFDVVGCKFSGCVRAVNWDTPGGSAKYERIRFSNNRILDCTDIGIAIGLAAAGLGWNALDITDNYIDGGSSSNMMTGIQVGFLVTSSVAATQAKWKNVRVTGNFVSNVDGGATDIGLGIAVYGTSCQVSDNRIDGVISSVGGQVDNCGIQAAFIGGVISGNTITGVLASSVNQNVGINLTGTERTEGSPVLPYCHGIAVSDNDIQFDGVISDGYGIAIDGGASEIMMENNYIFEAIEGFTITQNSAVGLHNVTFRGNIVINDVIVGVGFSCEADGDNWLIDGNLFEGHSIAMRFSSVEMSSLIISNNICTQGATDGILITQTNRALENVQIINNHFDSFTDGIHIGVTAIAIDNMQFSGNTFVSVSNDINISDLTPTNYRKVMNEVEDSRAQIHHAAGDLKVGDGAWNSVAHFMLGTRRFWFDSTGDLRINASVPTSSLDGTVVGAQS